MSLLFSWEPRILMVGEGEGTGGGGGLHIPRTIPDGIFAGETGIPDADAAIVLDDASLQPFGLSTRVDHDARVLHLFKYSEQDFPTFTPDAVFMGFNAARRAVQEPLDSFSQTPRTAWVFTAGFERDVVDRGKVYASRFWSEDVVPYAGGSLPDNPVLYQERSLQAWDFKWTVNTADQGSREATMYRQARFSYPIDNAVITDDTVQAHIEGVFLPGEWSVGRSRFQGGREVHVTEVLAVEVDANGNILRTLVNQWYTIARLSQVVRYPGQVFDGTVPEGADPEYRILDGYERLTGWVRYIPYVPVDVLRDFEYTSFPGIPTEARVNVFTAAEGQVKVSGPRTGNIAALTTKSGVTAILTAYGHEFTGGSWAALRDTPVRLEDTPEGEPVWDFTPHIILHANASTVSAVRPDGELLSIPLYLFETEVLRVDPGSFTGFSPVGTLFNTWPPQWAWADVQNEAIGVQSRALAAYDVWRDTQKRGAALGSPPRWTWGSRPGKRPKLLPETAPVAPLGVTLADVTALVSQDEVLARGEGPLLLPLTAVAVRDDGPVDVMAAVAKRILYQPAEWPQERDDRKATAGPLVLTFPETPRPGDGQSRAAALLLRLKTTKPTIKVNDQEIELIRLGHNASEKRGWHPYTVPVPVGTTYTLEFTGQCSRALLCVRVFDVPATP
ncbi:hypothetical protein [Deinococcus humi]|uniref:Uncharacterized protein n=1 Tax=Deinococcus humi TaxID=662880 RepID=A0A7W8JRX0_9DEIO|nr:hypothetical protein [Deinococcus humi]MBB5362061.1 hypothetical protein [Deinococcus humi]GGO22271.1 hypothetical protein GCM10008949_09340 [Deinococcus humi]